MTDRNRRHLTASELSCATTSYSSGKGLYPSVAKEPRELVAHLHGLGWQIDFCWIPREQNEECDALSDPRETDLRLPPAGPAGVLSQLAGASVRSSPDPTNPGVLAPVFPPVPTNASWRLPCGFCRSPGLHRPVELLDTGTFARSCLGIGPCIRRYGGPLHLQSWRKNKSGPDQFQPRFRFSGFPSRLRSSTSNTSRQERKTPSMPKICQKICSFPQLAGSKPLALRCRSTKRIRTGAAAY